MIHVIEHNHEYVYSTPTTAPRLITLTELAFSNRIRYVSLNFDYSRVYDILDILNSVEHSGLWFVGQNISDESSLCFYCKDEKGNNVHVAVNEI